MRELTIEQAAKAAFLVAGFRHAIERDQRIAEIVIRAVEINPKLRQRLAATLREQLAR
jgi:hypothetical protein